MYGHDSVLRAVIFTGFCVEVIATMTLMVFVIREQTVTLDCVATALPSMIVAFWYAKIAFSGTAASFDEKS